MQLKAERYRSRFRTLFPRRALRWWLLAPDALKTGAIPAAAANESAEANREESPTSARNSAVKTTPMPGKLLTISASGFVARSFSERRSSSAILPLVLSISEASSAASADLASAAGSSRHIVPWRPRLSARRGLGPCERAWLLATGAGGLRPACGPRSEEHTSELQSRQYLVC